MRRRNWRCHLRLEGPTDLNCLPAGGNSSREHVPGLASSGFYSSAYQRQLARRGTVHIQRIFAAIMMALLRDRSLRWQARRAVGLQSGAGTRDLPTIKQALLRATAIWWLLPLLATASVLALAVGDPCLPGGSCRPRATVLSDGPATRSLLVSIWQVQAAVLALVVAAVLFAFESAIRQRPSTPLHEYAARAGLAQFIYLGAAGLLSVGGLLMWSPHDPPVAAAAVALMVSAGGLASVPLLASRAMRVIGPDWFREARLRDIRDSVDEYVRQQALQLGGYKVLQETRPDIEVGLRYLLSERISVEVAETDGEVYDLRLDRLDALRRANALRVTAALGERVRQSDRLIDVSGVAPSTGRRCVRIVPPRRRREVVAQTALLFEEGMTAIRSGSPAAIEEVTDAYATLWLAWPRTWSELGHRLRGGLLTGLEPFGIGPVGKVRQDYLFLLEEALRQGNRDQVLSLVSLPGGVTREAIELDADDLIRQMTLLLQGFVTIDQTQSDFAHLAVDRGWRTQVELCELHLAGRIGDDELAEEEAHRYAELIRLLYESITHTLRLLHDHGWDQDFELLDGRFLRILEHWSPEEREPLARAIVEDPDRFDAGPEQVERARNALVLYELRDNLTRLRRGYRLSVLAWILDQAIRGEAGERRWERIRAYAQRLGSVDELVASVAVALDDDEPLSGWVMSRIPEGPASSVDVEGSALRALVLALLLKRGRAARLPPSAWMTESRIDRAKATVEEVAKVSELQEWFIDGETTLGEASERLGTALDQAWEAQRELEDRQLAERDLDPNKVRVFKLAVVDGWRENRVSSDLLSMARCQPRNLPVEDFGDERFGFNPSLEPKGLFVSPTHWVGLEQNAEDFGRQLARGEVTSIVRHVTTEAGEFPVDGSSVDRLRALIGTMEAEGHAPTLLITAIDWQLARELGLPEHREPAEGEGQLGHSIIGWFNDVPVLKWRDVPRRQVFAVELAAFCDVLDGVDRDGTPLPPTVDIDPIGEALASEIICGGEPETDPVKRVERRRRVLTSVRVHIRRPYRVEIRDIGAARWIGLEQADEA